MSVGFLFFHFKGWGVGGGGGGEAFQTRVFIFSFQGVRVWWGRGGKSSRRGEGWGGWRRKGRRRGEEEFQRREGWGGGGGGGGGGLGGLEKRRPATATLRLGNNRLAFLRILLLCGSDLEIDSICLVFIEFFLSIGSSKMALVHWWFRGGGLEKRRPATATLRLGNNRLAFLRILLLCGSDLEIDSICLVFIEFFSFNWEFKNGFGSLVVYFGSGDSL